MNGQAILTPVHNHRIPPEDFLETLVDTIKGLPDALFAPVPNYDVFSSVAYELPFTKDSITRKAYMCEILRCLGAFESDYNWKEGKDITNPEENSVLTESAGVFQISADSMNFHGLRDFVIHYYTTDDPVKFRWLMMNKHAFTIEYTVRLLRLTTKHNGPIRDKKINPYLSMEAVNEFKQLL